MRCNRPQTTNKYMNIVPSRFSNQRFFIWFNLEFGTIWKVRSSLLDSVNTTFGQQTKGSFFSLNRPLVRCNPYVSCTFVFFLWFSAIGSIPWESPFLVFKQLSWQSSTLFLFTIVDKILQTMLVVTTAAVQHLRTWWLNLLWAVSKS